MAGGGKKTKFHNERYGEYVLVNAHMFADEKVRRLTPKQFWRKFWAAADGEVNEISPHLRHPETWQ